MSIMLSMADSPFIRDYFKNPSAQSLESLASYWYNLTLYNTKQHNFNNNYNMRQIYLWVNAPVFDEDNKEPLGMLGTAINLTNSNFELVNNKVRLDEYFTDEMEWYAVISYPQHGLFALNQSMNILFFSMHLEETKRYKH